VLVIGRDVVDGSGNQYGEDEIDEQTPGARHALPAAIAVPRSGRMKIKAAALGTVKGDSMTPTSGTWDASPREKLSIKPLSNVSEKEKRKFVPTAALGFMDGSLQRAVRGGVAIARQPGQFEIKAARTR
jgi:hypothetical protein